MMTAKAVARRQDLGFSFDLTPPVLFSGEKMELSNSGVEALIVPVDLPQGRLEINVAIRERI